MNHKTPPHSIDSINSMDSTADALDRAVDAVNQEPLDEQVAQAAAARVWNRLAAHAALTEVATTSDAGRDLQPIQIADATGGTEVTGAIQGCAGFQALIPAFLTGSLPAERARLVEDHTRECVACRRALKVARRGVPAGSSEKARSQPAGYATSRPAFAAFSALKWAAGLGAVLLAGFLAYRVSPLGIGPVSAEIASIQGELLLDGTEPLAAGAILGRDQVVRTTSHSGAVLALSDGSRVELAERSVLRLDRRRDGVVLSLEEGGLIVEAAEKRGTNQHLYVRTDDCLVSVTGTVFSVRHGAKGSRVSVLRGEVRIENRGSGRGENSVVPAVFRSGDQFTSRTDLAHVPLEQDVRWSRDAARYREDIAALRQIGREIDQALTSPARTSTRLLDLLPAATAIYVAVPNVAPSLGDAWDRLREQVNSNPALAAWWADHVGVRGEQTLEEAVAELRTIGAHLGSEVVAAVVADDSVPVAAGPHDTHAPVLLAEVPNPNAFSPVLDAEIARFNERATTAGAGANSSHDTPRLRRITAPPTGTTNPNEALVWLRGDLLLISSNPELLTLIDGAASGRSNGFVGSSFHGRLASIYRDGAGWVAGMNARSAMPATGVPPATGFDGLDSIVFNASSEDASGGGGVSSRALVSFADQRHGIASWLAAPAPSGALEFVSPEAHLAVSVLLKQPTDMLDDLLRVAQNDDPSALQALARFEAEHGIAVREDLAATLGGDVAFALDGPWLPQPTWKLAVEVVDATRLQSTLVRMVDEWNRAIADRADRPAPDSAPDSTPAKRLVLSQEAAAGRAIYKLVAVPVDGGAGAGGTGGASQPVYYLYEGGYLVAGPNPTLLVEAVAQRAAGISLAGSQRFTALLPRDGQVHFSAVVYQDLGAVAGMVGSWLASASPLGEEGREQISALSQQSAGLVVAYGLDDAVEIAGRSTEGVFGLGFQKLLGLAGAFGGSHAPADGAGEAGSVKPRKTRKVAPPAGVPAGGAGTKSRVAA